MPAEFSFRKILEPKEFAVRSNLHPDQIRSTPAEPAEAGSPEVADQNVFNMELVTR